MEISHLGTPSCPALWCVCTHEGNRCCSTLISELCSARDLQISIFSSCLFLTSCALSVSEPPSLIHSHLPQGPPSGAHLFINWEPITEAAELLHGDGMPLSFVMAPGVDHNEGISVAQPPCEWDKLGSIQREKNWGKRWSIEIIVDENGKEVVYFPTLRQHCFSGIFLPGRCYCKWMQKTALRL